MIDYLIQRFLPTVDGGTIREQRKQYGYLSAWIGIVSNLLLCVAKFTIGFISNSMAIMADAVNNLSDIGTSLLTILSFKLAGKGADKNHPFGHARFEYIFSSAMAVVILFVGGQFFYESIKRFWQPVPIKSSPILYVILILSILVKLWLYVFYRHIAKKIDSELLLASAQDSLADILSTSVILISMLLMPFVSWNLDSIMGVLVALIILKSGFDILRRMIDKIVGSQPNRTERSEIKQWIYTYKGVHGVHDLIIHEYGPDYRFISVHVEVDSRMTLVDAHNLIDRMENDALREHEWQLLIHVDPVDLHDPELIETRELVETIVRSIHEKLSIHDLRIVRSGKRSRLFFDCVIPDGVAWEDADLKRQIEQKLSETDRADYDLTITFDRNYVSSSAE